MKKNLLRILCSVICACILCLGLGACGGSGWTISSLNNPGGTDKAEYARAGFVAETENYIFYLNGLATATDNNTFGVPVKGALMAVDKTDLTSKTEVVVPKLFTSKNYEQGLFIYDGYVYYGTPSTNKTSSGSIATSDMVFTRSSLDGKATTEALYVVGSHSTDYKFVENDGVVYIVYYDTEKAAIVSVNTSTKEVKEIVKTDAKVAVETPVDGEYGESLNTYKFVGDKVIYTTTVYNAPYNEEMQEDNGTARGTAAYNKVYVFEAGKEPQLLLNGKATASINDTTYELKYVDAKSGKIFIGETDDLTKLSAVYRYELTETLVKGIKVNADYLVDTNILDGDNVYTLDTGTVYVDSIAKGSLNKEIVAKCDSISSLLFVEGAYLYYLNSNNQVCKILLESETAHEIVITENSVATTWYDPAIVNLAGKDYLFFVDSSSYGLNYVKYVELDDDKIVEEDTDEDGETDKWAYKKGSSQFLGKISDSDRASMFTATVNALSGELDGGAIAFEMKDGKYVVENDKLIWKALADARDEYENLPLTTKAKVSASTLETLEKYERALEMASVYNKLDGLQEFYMLGAPEGDKYDAFMSIYNQVKDQLTKFESSTEFDNIKGFINNNFKHLFQTAKKLFEESK